MDKSEIPKLHKYGDRSSDDPNAPVSSFFEEKRNHTLVGESDSKFLNLNDFLKEFYKKYNLKKFNNVFVFDNPAEFSISEKTITFDLAHITITEYPKKKGCLPYDIFIPEAFANNLQSYQQDTRDLLETSMLHEIGHTKISNEVIMHRLTATALGICIGSIAFLVNEPISPIAPAVCMMATNALKNIGTFVGEIHADKYIAEAKGEDFSFVAGLNKNVEKLIRSFDETKMVAKEMDDVCKKEKSPQKTGKRRSDPNLFSVLCTAVLRGYPNSAEKAFVENALHKLGIGPKKKNIEI